MNGIRGIYQSVAVFPFITGVLAMAAYSSLFLTAFMMSILAAAQPGIITFEAIRRGAVRGFRGAFYVEVGSLIGDAVWSLAALTGAALLFQNQ
ncbi:MAG: LysE family transporter, partial [Phototrophicaceae bacterium]